MLCLFCSTNNDSIVILCIVFVVKTSLLTVTITVYLQAILTRQAVNENNFTLLNSGLLQSLILISSLHGKY